MKMITPIRAYVTFDTMEGKERAVKYLGKESTFGLKNVYFEPFKILGE
jgi:hypothetical protein